MYYACMPHVQVRDVPDDVHETLVRRAEVAGQSLQQYLAAQLSILAATPTLDDVIDRIERRNLGSVSSSAALRALEADRAGR
jgi:antitoxin FitA